MSNFLSRVQWSSDRFSLKKIVELFPLPQVVQVQKGLLDSESRNVNMTEGLILLLHSVRTVEKIRATDSLKEFYVPCDSSARVEIIWKDYKRFYDNVEELTEDFPHYVLVLEDGEFGLQKGDILKLKQKTLDNKYLQCSVVNRVCKDIHVNIPFSYKGLFKTLGDLKEEHVLLSDVIQCCTLPVAVKFIDNKLKMKRIDGSSRFPVALCNLENVMLHKVVDYCDIMAIKLLTDEANDIVSIPLENQNIKVNVPTAATRSDKSYSQYCDNIVRKISPQTLQRVGIQQHSEWIVYQDGNESTPQNHQRCCRSSSLSCSVSSLKVDQEEEQNGCKILGASVLDASSGNIQTSHASPTEPIYSQVIRDQNKTPSELPTTPPPIPPKEFTYSSMRPGNKSPQRTQGLGRRFSEPVVQDLLTEKMPKRKSSFPYLPTLSERSTDSFKIYESIVIGKISQDRDQERDVMPILLDKFGGSKHLDDEDGYVTMKPNVMTEDIMYKELQSKFTSGLDGNTATAVLPNIHTEGKSIQKSQREHVQDLNRPPIPLPPYSAQETQIQSESKLQMRRNLYEDVSPLKVNADRRNDFHSDKKTKTPPKLEFLEKDVRNWSERDVAKFLKNINLDQYIKKFKDKKVDGKVLENLNEDTLTKDMKITNKSHVLRLMRFKEECIKHEKSAIQNMYHPS